MGIGGTGMSALAEILRARGEDVSGCDLNVSGEAARYLSARGVTVLQGHDPAHLERADVLVVSSAVAQANPERQAASRRGIPVRHRAEVLAEALSGRKLVAVAGAHGKTTTTALIAHVLAAAGLDPLAAVGFGLPGNPTGARAGAGPWAVAEVDESDGSFLRFCPRIAVVTTIEPDHLENWEGSFERLVEAYARFLEQTQADGVWVLGLDSPQVRRLLGGDGAQAPRLSPGSRRAVGYALSAQPEGAVPVGWTARSVHLEGRRCRFVAVRNGRDLAEVRLSIPGVHNVANALAALAVAEAAGVDLELACRSMEEFTGARRRFEVLASSDRAMVVDDYAHHPTEIAATIRAARQGFPGWRVAVVFQPHRYHRTAALMDELAGAFDEADEVILTEIYAPPPEQPIPGVSGLELFRRLCLRPAWRSRPRQVRFAPTLDEAYAAARERGVPGTMWLVMGAGDVTRLAHRLAEAIGPRG